MDVVVNLQTLTPTQPVLLTIGKFDGVHRAHQHLIRQLVARAQASGAQSAVLTFDPHPDTVLRPERDLRCLTTIDERAALIADLGVDILVVLPFDAAMSQLSAADFMAWLCEHMQLRELWVGPDFRLGHRALGTVSVLRELGQQLGYSVHTIELWTLDGEHVRSSTIRALLSAGRVADAKRYLGRPFTVTGTVVAGDQRGRTIGFPTANIAVTETHMLPADGVYACHAELLDTGGIYNAVTNVGVRPTFGVLGRTVEAHLFDFSGDLYGQQLRLAFIEHIRPEQRFASIDALVRQIGADAEHAKLLLDTVNPV